MTVLARLACLTVSDLHGELADAREQLARAGQYGLIVDEEAFAVRVAELEEWRRVLEGELDRRALAELREVVL